MSATLPIRRWWKIMPIVFITYSLAYLDRANFSFASAAGINQDLGIAKGLASLLGALFFLGYFFFQIPGAVYAERRSVKRLVFWCLVLWGGCAALTGLVSNIPSLLAAIRFVARRGGGGRHAGHADLHQQLVHQSTSAPAPTPS